MQYPVSSVKLCCASNDFTILFHLGLDLARPLNAINSNYFRLKPETDLDSTFDQLPAENPLSVEGFWSSSIFSIFTLKFSKSMSFSFLSSLFIEHQHQYRHLVVH